MTNIRYASRASQRNALLIQHCYSPFGTTQYEKTVKNKPHGPKYTLFGPVEVSNDLNRVLHGISLYCIYCFVFDCIAWYCVVLHCIVLHGIVLHLIICYGIAWYLLWYYMVFYCFAWYCIDYTVLCS